MKTRSITQKFGIWLVFVTLFVMIVFGVVNYFLFINQLNKDLDARLDESASKIIDLLALHVWNLDNQRVQAVAQEQAFLESFARLRVFNSFGDLIYEAGEPDGGELASTQRDIVYEGNVAGSVVVAFSTENIAVAKSAVIRSTLVIIFAVTLTVLVLTFFIVRSISRPIVRLTETAKNIAGGNLNQRVEVKSKDEIGQLGDAFNIMTSKLKKSYEGLEEKVRQRTAELSESNKLKDLFIDIMRHDLLNPAGVVKTSTQVALMDEKDSKKKENLQLIENSSDRLIKMIENASVFAKLESGEKIELKEMDLGVILKDAVEGLISKAEERKIKIKLDAKGEFLANVNPLIGDVIANFITNAIKYGPADSEIVVAIKKENGNYRMSVADKGEGIEDKYKTAIFDRFTRLEKGAIKGSGLGLAIVKKIVELHNGKVWVENNSPKGSVFIVEIPRRLEVSNEIKEKTKVNKEIVDGVKKEANSERSKNVEVKKGISLSKKVVTKPVKKEKDE